MHKFTGGLDDIFELSPTAKHLWLQNERYRQLRAKTNGVSVRMMQHPYPCDLRHGYFTSLMLLVQAGELKPMHVKYLTGLSHTAYAGRAQYYGMKRQTKYPGNLAFRKKQNPSK